MQIINTNNELLIKLNKNILDEKEVFNLIEFLKMKEILSKSKLKCEDIKKLDDELKAKWWNKNREKILGIVNDSN